MIEFPPLSPGEPLSISASLYKTYLRCPANALANVSGQYSPDSRASFSGMLAHRVFARHLTGGPIAAEEFDMACRAEIGQALNPKLGSLALRPSELRGVIAEVGELYQRFQAVSAEGCRSVELELVVAVSPEVSLRGRVDAVFDDARGVRVVDWKTGALGEAESQLDFYALLWGLEYGELPAVVEAVSVASGERFVKQPAISDTAATARIVATMVTALRDAFEAPDSIARHGGPGCRYCPLQDDCAEGMSALRVLSA